MADTPKRPGTRQPDGVPARHYRGATVHAVGSSCLKRPGKPVTLTGATRRDGETWRPCVRCGASLVVDVAKQLPADTRVVLVMHPLTDDSESWQVEQRDDALELFAAVRDGLGLRSVGDPDSSAPAAYGRAPRFLLDVLRGPFGVHAVPDFPADTNPGLPDVADVFTRMLRAERIRWVTITDSVRWAADRWTVAAGVAAPVLVGH